MPIRDSRAVTLAGVGLLAGAIIAGCSSSTTSGSGASPSASRGSGKVEILYAGSLVNVMEKSIGPAFSAATGYTYEGEGAGSTQLANEIKGKVKRADVFISASAKSDQALEGAKNGDWVTSYATFGSSPLVLGYNPNSSFAAALKTKPWYQVLTESGIKIGRTDPKLDPKGELTATALTAASTTFKDATLATTVEKNSQIFPEEDLVGRLESGQLDVGFFYTVEATAAKIPTVSLDLPTEKATYTVAVLNNAPDRAGATAFVNYLLSAAGREKLSAAGIILAN
jgi:molybdate/tungstate transport system substrate-binding protein